MIDVLVRWRGLPSRFSVSPPGSYLERVIYGWVGRKKGLVFLIVLPLMFVTGLWLEGRLFPFEPSQPLVMLASIADLGIGVTYFLAQAAGYGAGRVVATTYEYGNTFLIVAGLLNCLVVFDVVRYRVGTQVRLKACENILRRHG